MPFGFLRKKMEMFAHFFWFIMNKYTTLNMLVPIKQVFLTEPTSHPVVELEATIQLLQLLLLLQKLNVKLFIFVCQLLTRLWLTKKNKKHAVNTTV